MVFLPTIDPSARRQNRGNMLMEMGSHPLKPMLKAPSGAIPRLHLLALAGVTFLQEGIIHGDKPPTTEPTFPLRSLKVGCHSHGSPIPLVPSIATSETPSSAGTLPHALQPAEVPLHRRCPHHVERLHGVDGLRIQTRRRPPRELRGLIPNAPFNNKALARGIHSPSSPSPSVKAK
jgi:penicillin-binding protein 2